MFFAVQRTPITAAALCLALVLAAHPAQAQQKITVGTTNGVVNGIPFGLSNTGQPLYAAGNEFQEIYSSTYFQAVSSGPLTISDIAFASSSSFGFVQPSTATYNVTLSLSTTKAQVNVNSFKADFAANKGADFTQVFNGTLTANLQANNTFDLVFPTAPFTYDPSQGNLLFDLVVNQGASGTGEAEFLTTSGSQTLRAYKSGATSPTFVDQFGLYTQFTAIPAAAVPEASTTVSFGLLLAFGAGFAAFKRKRSGKAA